MDHDKDPKHEPTRPEPPEHRPSREEEDKEYGGVYQPPGSPERPGHQGGGGRAPIDPPSNTTNSDF